MKWDQSLRDGGAIDIVGLFTYQVYCVKTIFAHVGLFLLFKAYFLPHTHVTLGCADT